MMQRGVKSMIVAEILLLHNAAGSKIFQLHLQWRDVTHCCLLQRGVKSRRWILQRGVKSYRCMMQWGVKSYCMMQRGIESMIISEIFLPHNAAGSQILLLHIAAGRCDSLLRLAAES
jgi:hypothetical protein